MPTPSDLQLLQLPVDQLAPDPDQPRTDYTEEALRDLAASLQTHGVLEPLLVFRNPDLEERRNHPYRILVGERRWRAAKLAGLETVPAILRRDAIEPGDRLILQIAENDEREELSLLDRARAIARALEMSGLAKKDFAQKVRRSQPWLSNQLAVSAATGLCLEALEHRLIRHADAARLFQKLPEADQRRLLGQAVRSRVPITQSQIQRVLDRRQEEAEAAKTAPEDSSPPEGSGSLLLIPLGEVDPKAFRLLLGLLGAEVKSLPPIAPENLPLLVDAFRDGLSKRLVAAS